MRTEQNAETAPILSRRQALAALALLSACKGKRSTEFVVPSSFAQPSRERAQALDASAGSQASTPAPRFVLDTWSLGGDREVAVAYPNAAGAADASARFPVLIALHGRGEARKAPKDGAMGWFRDYELLRALERIDAAPLTGTDFRGLVEPARLAQINTDLTKQPYRGMVVVCPYLPDIDLQKPAQATEFGRYLVKTLLPEVHARTPSLKEASNTAIDGVSLGGATAMQVGFEHPLVFGSVGGIQPAIQYADIPLWAERATRARSRNREQRLRLLTSAKDYFRDGIRGLAAELRKTGLSHEFLEAPGPHDYVFNQGPGAYELLYFHERGTFRNR